MLSTLTCLGLMTALTLPLLGDADTDVAAAGLAAPSEIISHTGSIYFSQRGHTLHNGLLSYWIWHGQTARLGCPPSAGTQAGGLTVQYFPRIRLA